MLDRLRLPHQSLSVRILFLMTLALLPLGIMSVLQTRNVVAEAQRITNTALLTKTRAAAAAERELIQEAVGAAQGLAISLALPDTECDPLLKRFVAATDPYIFAGFIEDDGIMRCSSRDIEVDFSSSSNFPSALNSTGPIISMSRQGAVTGESVVLVSHPVRRDGAPLGIVTLSIPHWVANPLLSPLSAGESGLHLVSINDAGVIVSATGDIASAEQFLPRDYEPATFFDRIGSVFSGTAKDGTRRFFTVVGMIEDELLLVGSWPSAAANVGKGLSGQVLVIGFPILMWLAGLAVAYIGLQRLVVRHIRDLRTAMSDFASGNRGGHALALDGASYELQEAQHSFNMMADIIADGEERQQQDLQDKEVLLREVHHRVKNNLQLIASIMNMQARGAKTPETKLMLAGLQRRVSSLAMLHRTLYTTPDMTTVDAGELVGLVVRETSTLASERHVRVETNLQSAELYPDQAVPLSMLVSEALTNAFKYAGTPDEAQTVIKVVFRVEEDGRLLLQIKNTLAEAPNANDGDGLGRRLMSAFVRQLEGSEKVSTTDEDYTLTVRFAPSGLARGPTEPLQTQDMVTYRSHRNPTRDRA